MGLGQPQSESCRRHACDFLAAKQKRTAVNEYVRFGALMNDCDIVLVEGDSQAKATKIEVFRLANGASPIATSDLTIHAIVTDDVWEIDAAIWKRSGLESFITMSSGSWNLNR